ncbi:MAG TPA: ABC transporter substrate-binding protein [Candidatus Binatia bacterium]|jgi:NitT/TauT family transport system substrate-binding protein
MKFFAFNFLHPRPLARPLPIAIPLCLILLLNQSLAHAQDLRRIFYGTTASPSHLPIWVAKDAGFFEKAGLDVEPVQIRGGSLITLAIITGNLPFSGAGAESVVAARAAGGDAVLLACPVDADPVYLITRPEIKSAQELKGRASAVTRYGSTTHFYLRAALKHVGLNPERDMTILQMGAGPEIVVALDRGVIAAAALTTRYAMPFLQRGWPVLVDLSNTDLVYPSSCVTSSRAFVRAEPKTTHEFLRAYVAGIHLIKKDFRFAEKSFTKWMREKDPAITKKTVESYARLFKLAPIVPDKGIENVVHDLVKARPEFKDYLGWPEPFRDNAPLEKVLKER